MQLVASFLFHSVVAFDSRLTLTFAFRTEHIDTNHGKYTRSSLFWESDAKSGPWLEPMIITRLTSSFFFFLIFLKTKSKYVFVSYKSWFIFQYKHIKYMYLFKTHRQCSSATCASWTLCFVRQLPGKKWIILVHYMYNIQRL